MAGPFEVAGSPARPSHYSPIYTGTIFTGLWSQRSPLRDAATPLLYARFYQATRYDSILGGNDCEVTTRLTLARRPGCSVYNSQTFPPINTYYEFRQIGASRETISIIADTASTVYDATGPANQVSIFTKSSSAGQTYFQNIGSILYFGDGVDQEKYISVAGSFTTQLWGIAIGSVNVASGPNNAGTGSDVSTGGQAWTNPTNIQNTGSAAGCGTLSA